MRKIRFFTESSMAYSTKICKVCGEAERHPSGDCAVCSRRRAAEYYALHKEKVLAANKRWREENPEKATASVVGWQQRNSLQMKSTSREYRLANLGKHCASQTKRKAGMLQRIPSWADLQKIRIVYENCPPGMQVDHIIPLQGKTVSGLHVHYNLQYLTPEENMKKGNRHA